MAIQESKLSAAAVKVRVNIILLSHGGLPAIVEQPNTLRRPADRGVPYLQILTASPVDVFVEAIMKKVVAITPTPFATTYKIQTTAPSRLTRIGVASGEVNPFFPFGNVCTSHAG